MQNSNDIFNKSEEYAIFEKEWILMKKYEFKLLTLCAALAADHKAYRGTIVDVCKYLGVQSGQTSTNRTIKTAIQSLVDREYISVFNDPDNDKIYTLTLRYKAEKTKDIRAIKKEFINLIKKDKSGEIAWEEVLRVYLYLVFNTKDIMTNAEIGKDLSISERNVKKAKVVLEKHLKLIITRNRSKKTGKSYVSLGQSIDCVAWIDG